MSMTDPIADLLTRIRNAAQARHASCEIPASNAKESILKILKENGYIKNYVRQEASPQDNLVVFLKYMGRLRTPIIKRLKRISKPGRRTYSGDRDLKPSLGGMGISIISTSKGVMTDADARDQKVGGEIICRVF